MIERLFRDLTQNRLRRGIFRDAEELILAIGEYIDRHNVNPKALRLDRQGLRYPRKGQTRSPGTR